MTLPYGEVVGLVGPNGAGKTTLLLVLAGLLSPDAGGATVAGADTVREPFEVHRLVGWMPDFFGVYDDLTLREYLVLFGQMYQLSRADAGARAAELLQLVGMEEKADVKVHTLSRGQKQRLGFARALVQHPRVLLLDEPASGLDPRARIQLRDLVRGQAAAGACVVVSSHILQELEEMADSVVFMEAGRCTGQYRINDLPETTGIRRWRFRSLDPAALPAFLTRAGFSFTPIPDGSVAVEMADERSVSELVTRLVGEGIALVAVVPETAGLEGAFLSMGGTDR